MQIFIRQLVEPNERPRHSRTSKPPRVSEKAPPKAHSLCRRFLRLRNRWTTEVRTQVAVAVPACSGDDVDALAVAALIELTRDGDADVRNWATFGLGRQLATDGQDVRDALWARVADESRDVREEAIAGLARRRDTRSLALVAQLLRDTAPSRPRVARLSRQHVDGDERLGSADHILAATGGDPVAAARRWVDLVTSPETQPRE